MSDEYVECPGNTFSIKLRWKQCWSMHSLFYIWMFHHWYIRFHVWRKAFGYCLINSVYGFEFSKTIYSLFKWNSTLTLMVSLIGRHRALRRCASAHFQWSIGPLDYYSAIIYFGSKINHYDYYYYQTTNWFSIRASFKILNTSLWIWVWERHVAANEH